MADIYENLRQVANTVFGEFKQGTVSYVALTAQAGATPDRPLPPLETPTVINATVRAVSTKYVDGSHIVQSDLEVSFPNSGFTPVLEGMFDIDGSRYKIIELMKRPSAGTPVSFTAIVRS